MITHWHWEVTRRCNLQCLHCIVGGTPSPELNPLLARNAIRRMAELGAEFLYLTGGEPLMRKDIGSLIREAVRHGIVVEMLTNGTLLGKSFFSSGGELLSRIGVSLDGPREVHDALRGKGSFGRTAAGIALALEQRIPVSVFFTLNALNRGRLKETVETALDMGAASIHINSVIAGGRAAQNRHILLSSGNADSKAAEIFRWLSDVVDTPLPAVNSDCTVSSGSMYLDSAGDVFVCSEIGIMEKRRRLGGILEQELEGNIQSFFRSFAPCRCRYSTFEGQGITLVLENGTCELRRRV